MRSSNEHGGEYPLTCTHSLLPTPHSSLLTPHSLLLTSSLILTFMTVRLTFHGAAGQVTGSMHLLEAAGARILLDAGLFQGRRAETRTLNANLPFDARRIDAVILSHAHIDHAGRLPLLVNAGYSRPDLRHARNPGPLGGDAAGCGAHPGEGRGVPAAARQGRAGERAALHHGRRGRGAGPHDGASLPSGLSHPQAPDLRVHRRRPHPGLGLGGSPDHRDRVTAWCSPATSGGLACRSFATPIRPPVRSTR